MKVLAPAKINLFLEVSGLRPDRYHEIETIFQTVSLYDLLEIKKNSKNSSRIKLTVLGDGGSLALCPPDSSNIVWKAADLFLKEFKVKAPVQITLEKNIPIQAGLGGGSSDAAAALNGLSKLFIGKKPSGFDRRLNKIAKACGADVPFLLQGGCALAEGIGEKIQRIPRTPQFWAVVVKPPVGCSTKDVYGWLDESRGWGKLAGLSVDDGLTNRPKIHKMSRLVRQGKSAGEWGKHLYNAFESVVFQKHPQLAKIKQFLLSEGAHAAGLSGSGSALFGLVSSKKAGGKIVSALDPSLGKAWVVRSV